MMIIRRRIVVQVASVLMLLSPALPAAAQQPSPRDGASALATRAELQATLAQLEQTGRPLVEIALIRSRLDNGDFQTGDRVFVRIEGEQQVSDTFTVGAGPLLLLPQLGEVPLAGVLRSELQGRLYDYVSRYIRNPVVHARPLIRILVDGEVARPGYYAVTSEQPVADALTAAGGLTPRAKVTGMRVERGSGVIWKAPQLHDAVGRGVTLDQLNLRAGDRVYVPARGDFERVVRTLGILVTIPVTLYAISRIH